MVCTIELHGYVIVMSVVAQILLLDPESGMIIYWRYELANTLPMLPCT